VQAFSGDHVRVEGVSLGVALGGLAVAAGLWGKHLMPGGNAVQARSRLASSEAERRAFVADLEAGEQPLVRRRTLLGLGALATGGLGLAALVPLRSLGPRPRTPPSGWVAGRRLVTQDGRPVGADHLALGGLLTVFPEGAGNPARSQVVLVQVGADVAATTTDASRSAAGHLAFSKVCTHAGCPVGLFDATTNELLCPCHQSLFDVLDGARPIAGPATRRLPQLPLAVSPQGELVAAGDLIGWIGPETWRQP
jgi:ubiquinol-cytochrome c reductase iron-sulfur subunit